MSGSTLKEIHLTPFEKATTSVDSRGFLLTNSLLELKTFIYNGKF